MIYHKKEIVFCACKTCETRILELPWPLGHWLALPYLPFHISAYTVHSRVRSFFVVSVQSKARMGLIAGLTGASLGTMIVIYTRALRKVALFSSECSSRARRCCSSIAHEIHSGSLSSHYRLCQSPAVCAHMPGL